MSRLAATGNAHHWQLQRPLFSLLGARCRILDEHDNLVLFAKRRALRLRERIEVFEDEGETQPALHIRTESILDLGATYVVTDSRSGEGVGMARRRFMKSMLRDHWDLLDAGGNPLGEAQEDSMALALLRRLVADIVPQRFHVSVGGRPVAELHQRWNPFLFRADLRMEAGADALLDPRLLLGLAVLLMVIEGRQDG
ncbi:MAG: hypothetical protein JRH10_05550 [Deltaproteobacteria bacterium]|nr:hypothetical protein [Deltaproteobacteria bacterium]MBW2448201.1 hypothetical protein [Deltaproteobacteria bacterium]